MTWYEKLQKWHDTKPGLAVFGLAELALAYAFASWAIDTGSLIDWFLAIMLLIGGLTNIFKLGKKVVVRGRK